MPPTHTDVAVTRQERRDTPTRRHPEAALRRRTRRPPWPTCAPRHTPPCGRHIQPLSERASHVERTASWLCLSTPAPYGPLPPHLVAPSWPGPRHKMAPSWAAGAEAERRGRRQTRAPKSTPSTDTGNAATRPPSRRSRRRGGYPRPPADARAAPPLPPGVLERGASPAQGAPPQLDPPAGADARPPPAPPPCPTSARAHTPVGTPHRGRKP